MLPSHDPGGEQPALPKYCISLTLGAHASFAHTTRISAWQLWTLLQVAAEYLTRFASFRSLADMQNCVGPMFAWCRGLVVLGAPDTLSSDGRWLKWMSWVRDNGGLLAPEALLLTAEEKGTGKFDPDVNAATLLLQKAAKPKGRRQR